MRLSRHPPLLLPSLILLLPSLTAAIDDCQDILVDDKHFKLSALNAPYSVVRSVETPQSVTNTTFTINFCQALKKPKGVPRHDYCPNGTNVCAIKRIFYPEEDTVDIVSIPIAGDYRHTTGGDLNQKWTRFRASPHADDRKKEGLRLVMEGPKYPPQDKKGKKQEAVVEFLCNKKEQEHRRRGLAGESVRREDGEGEGKVGTGGEEVEDGSGGKLRFQRYEDVDGVMVLNLEWETKYACEDFQDDDGDSGVAKPSSGHWGFFTWFIIILFLATATYLIFGSWLNYNRYSARGWDLLPHSETIRDVPYLLRDWMRRVVNTVQGGGSRGGYSAV